MPRFQDLPITRSEDLNLQRALGIRAENADQALLGLLYVRQIHDARGNLGLPTDFRHEWHNVIHGRVGVLDDDRQRDAFLCAARAMFRLLAHDLAYHDDQWSRRRRLDKSPEDVFKALHEDLVALDAAVNRRLGASAAARDPRQDRRLLGELRRRGGRLHQATPAQKRMIALYLACIELALDNHAGSTASVEGSDAGVSRELLSAAFLSSGVDHRMAIEYSNRVVVRATNRLEFDQAWERILDLKELFVGNSALHDEALGALLGTLGQTYGLIAGRDNDQGLLDDAEECFHAARGHFELPDDTLRQDVYLLHTAVARLRLAPAVPEVLAALTTALTKAAATLRAPTPGRVDYLVGAYLKGCDALDQEPKLYARCVELTSASIANLDEALKDPAIHGLVCACGWLLLTGSAPRKAVQLVNGAANSGGLIGTIAGLFVAEAKLRGGRFDEDERAHLLDALSGEDRSKWVELLGPALSSPGARLIERVPFNFA